MDFDRYIEDTIKSFKTTKDYIYNKQVLIELYETHYNICDHLNSVNPLSSIQFNKAEEYIKNYLYDAYLNTFIYRELGKKLNMSWDDFINRPKYEIESIIRIVSSIDEKKMKANESVINELETSKSRNKPPIFDE